MPVPPNPLQLHLCKCHEKKAEGRHKSCNPLGVLHTIVETCGRCKSHFCRCLRFELEVRLESTVSGQLFIGSQFVSASEVLGFHVVLRVSLHECDTEPCGYRSPSLLDAVTGLVVKESIMGSQSKATGSPKQTHNFADDLHTRLI